MMKATVTIESADKIDVEDLIKDFKVMSIDNFQSYLKEVWRDLSQRSDDKTKGVNKLTFSKYYELPGIICDRLFAVFDINKNDYLDLLEFTEGMTTLFTEGYLKLCNFIFDFYDFNKDGKISRDDVRVVLSYIPLNKKSYSSLKLKYEQEEFKDRIESQEELHSILERSFSITQELDQLGFQKVVENACSDIFLFILIFLLEKRPFSKGTLDEFANSKKKTNTNTLQVTKTPQITSNKYLIASPSLQSKFSPSVTISKSPSMSKRGSMNFHGGGGNVESKNMLLKLSGKTENTASNNPLLKYAGKSNQIKSEIPEEGTDEGVMINDVKNIPIQRKQKVNLKNLETVVKEDKKNYGDLPITGAFKQTGKNDQISTNTNLKISSDDDSDDDEEDTNIKYEGFLYKITQTKKLKKLWFKLHYKDLYYFKTQEEQTHKGMHNLSGVFVKEDQPISYEGNNLFCFQVVYPKKSRFYYVDNEQEYQAWMKVIRKVTGYENLSDIYEVKDKLGNGKFGLVRLGIHKPSGRKVAVKIMNKKDMTQQDLELVKTEIEILKISQQPNIIRLYDIFENIDYIYIIMEYCSGGDLFSYIEKRGFKLSEPRAAALIHKLSAAVFYLHSYGIAHRDLKPENILMTDNTDEADLKLLDFGLSKIIGPSETCSEPFGTLSYVAPEVLLEKPYNKAVDLWSIGIITYLLLCGCLPFDDENSEREIARQTINDPVPYPSSIWKKISNEAKTFVDNLLQKDPNNRMSIREVLEHPWIQKHVQSTLIDTRRKSKDISSSNFKLYTTTEENSEKKK